MYIISFVQKITKRPNCQLLLHPPPTHNSFVFVPTVSPPKKKIKKKKNKKKKNKKNNKKVTHYFFYVWRVLAATVVRVRWSTKLGSGEVGKIGHIYETEKPKINSIGRQN